MRTAKISTSRCLWVILILFFVTGFIYPIIGFIALICMMGPILYSFVRGRMWCGNYCPRGSFNSVVLSKISTKKAMPKFLKSKLFRLLFLAVLMSVFVFQLIMVWGKYEEMGKVFVRMVFLTTILAIILGWRYNYRTWCLICPMGTMSNYVADLEFVKARIKHITFIKERCIDCKICSKNCPMGIDVLQYKEHGKVLNADCIKCEICIQKCHTKSLYLE